MSDATRPCIECSKEFTAPTMHLKLCSQECRVARSRRTSLEKHYANRGDPEYQRSRVKAAHKSYLKMREDPASLAVNRALTADWRSRNKDATASQYKTWRLANAQRVAEKNRRRRARLMDAWVEDVDIEVLWVRDRGTCGICSEPIDRNAIWPDRESLTVDHYIPLIHGGLHCYLNIQLAHAVCNSRKCDRLAS